MLIIESYILSNFRMKITAHAHAIFDIGFSFQLLDIDQKPSDVSLIFGILPRFLIWSSPLYGKTVTTQELKIILLWNLD